MWVKISWATNVVQMELWATNPDVESKGALTEGTQLKYWPDVAGSALAKNEGDGKKDETARHRMPLLRLHLRIRL